MKMRRFRLAALSVAAANLVSAFLPAPPRPAFAKRRLENINAKRIQATRPCPLFPRSAVPRFAAVIRSAPADEDFDPAEDLEALQALFSKYCDSDGLMNKQAVMRVSSIAELLADGDVLPEEFDEIWTKAPKFPDEEKSEERVDVDSFVQIYRDIDDLFEDDDEDAAEASAEVGTVNGGAGVAPKNGGDDDNDGSDNTMESELEEVFRTICDEDNLLSFASIQQWDEVKTLLEDGLLGADELEALWARTQKAPGSADRLDVDGFLSFNIELDGLFEFDDEGMEDDDVDETDDDATETAVAAPESEPRRSMVSGEELSDALFSALMGKDGKVGMSDLMYWSELKEMLADGDLLGSELNNLFTKAGQGKSRLEESEFQALVESIDDLFEEVDEDTEGPATSQPSSADALKRELLETLREFDDPDLLPCGLDLDEKAQKIVLDIVADLEAQPDNLVRQKAAAGLTPADLAGSWELLYSSSAAMRFNKGLSGLGGSFPRGRFAGLRQTLTATKFLADVEYTERIEVDPASASFDVTITGSWEVRSSVSLFTGEPSVVLTVTPDMVSYGPTSMRADHWKSLGPTNMLDVTYLDADLRVMRGNTAVENIFIYRRSR